MKEEGMIEIAYQTFTGREGRLTWKRKTVPASKVAATVQKLRQNGAREIVTRDA